MNTQSDINNTSENRPKGISDQQVIKLVSEVKPYVQHRMMIAEMLGIIPKNMYSPDGIIDDVMVEFLEFFSGKDTSGYDLKLVFIKWVKEHLDKILKDESWHQDSVSTDKLLHEELNTLRERYTYNADEDFIMNEDLSDISYQQKDFEKHLQLYSDYEQSFENIFDWESVEQPQIKAFQSIYNYLSLEASNIVDLHIFGRLTSDEIATIKGVSEPLVRKIILQVKDHINKIIDMSTEDED